MYNLSEPKRHAFAVLFVFLAAIAFADNGICGTTDDTSAFLTLMDLLEGSIGAIVILLSAVMTVFFSIIRKVAMRKFTDRLRNHLLDYYVHLLGSDPAMDC